MGVAGGVEILDVEYFGLKLNAWTEKLGKMRVAGDVEILA